MEVNKKELKEQEIRTLFITPALQQKGCTYKSATLNTSNHQKNVVYFCSRYYGFKL